MISKLSILLLTAVLVFGQSCGANEQTVTGTGADALDTDPLRASVPVIDGATEVERELPRAARSELGKLIPADWSYRYEAYESDRTAEELESFYNAERMEAAGWRLAGPCLGEGRYTSLSKGGVCLYTRTKTPSRKCLAIYVVEDPQEKETIIFYVRFDVAEPSGKLGEFLDGNR